MEYFELEINKRVAEVTLNRPEKLNAMHAAMLGEFDALFSDLKKNSDVSCVLLKGSGRAFSVGYDLVEIGEGSVGSTLMSDHDRLVRNTERWLGVWDFPKPIIAAVHGYCIAGAAFLASMTDITVVADDAVIAWARVPLGGGWLTPIFCHLVGVKKAMELSSIRGSQMTGKEAEAYGWANYAVPADEVFGKARELAEQMARVPSDLLMLNKRAGHRAMERLGFREAITGGIEYNNIAHFTDGAQYVRGKLRELGVQGVIEWFDNGGTLNVDFSKAREHV